MHRKHQRIRRNSSQKFIIDCNCNLNTADRSQSVRYLVLKSKIKNKPQNGNNNNNNNNYYVVGVVRNDDFHQLEEVCFSLGSHKNCAFAWKRKFRHSYSKRKRLSSNNKFLSDKNTNYQNYFYSHQYDANDYEDEDNCLISSEREFRVKFTKFNMSSQDSHTVGEYAKENEEEEAECVNNNNNISVCNSHSVNVNKQKVFLNVHRKSTETTNFCSDNQNSSNFQAEIEDISENGSDLAVICNSQSVCENQHLPETNNKYENMFHLENPRNILYENTFCCDVDEGDHNRILNQTITTPNGSKANGKPETVTTDLQENGQVITNNNNITDKSAANTRTNSRTSSPTTLLTNATSSNNTIIKNKKTPASPAVTATNNINDKKLQSKLHNSSLTSSSRKLILQKQHQQLSEDVTATTATTNSSLDVGDDLQQIKLLNRHSCNGALNYHAFEQQQQQLQHLQHQSEHHSKSTEALGVLLQYLVYDLDAFACPSLKSDSLKTKDKLKKTLLLLDEAKNVCDELQHQLADKDVFYNQKENDLQVLHRCELEKAQSNLMEFQSMAKQQISTLESQLQNSETENKRLLDSYRLEMENKLSQKLQKLDEVEKREKTLQQRLQSVEISEQQLRSQLTNTESSYAGRLQAASQREQDLSERLKQLTKELDKLKDLKENSERELKERLNLSNDEIAVLRTSRRSLNESGVSSPRSTSSLSSSAHMEINRLQSEAESLRCVLELKQKEISKLTKHNEELLRDADERSALMAKISLLESKNEMLLSEMEIKSEKEKEYLRQIDEVQKAYSHETVKRTRLSYDNEALQWQLKQRSEQLHIVETKLQELSAHDISNTSLANRSSLNGISINSNIHMEDISPPSSPVIKGVIEKNDSVSWVLEMDDETPEAAASKMVKRAGSFRSVERSPSTRRQLSISASATCGGNTPNFNASLIDMSSPIPLSQSMSATSVIREHSKVDTNEFNNRSAHPRIRSKSVSVKSCDGSVTPQTHQQQKCSKKIGRQLSSGNTRKPEFSASNWKEPVLASSPYAMRPRSSTLKINNESDEALFRRPTASKLITCDTSALNKGERLEMRSLPSHPSVQDLKVIKKCHEIRESAGEAMVSGTNSEDESCSASSDDVASSASSSAASDSTTSSNQLKNSHMSFEEVLLIEKINSLSGTPMEVSWSEDAEGLTNSSTL